MNIFNGSSSQSSTAKGAWTLLVFVPDVFCFVSDTIDLEALFSDDCDRQRQKDT